MTVVDGATGSLECLFRRPIMLLWMEMVALQLLLR